MSTTVVVVDNTAVITTEIDYYTPISYGAQGPQGPAGQAGQAGPAGPIGTVTGSLFVSSINDVDLTVLQDGAILVYDTASSTWKSTRILDKQTVECGQY